MNTQVSKSLSISFGQPYSKVRGGARLLEKLTTEVSVTKKSRKLTLSAEIHLSEIKKSNPKSRNPI